MANWNAPQLKTVNNNSLLGSGNITISGTGAPAYNISAPVTVTGTTDETEIGSLIIPGGTCASISDIWICPMLTRPGSQAGATTVYIKLGGTIIGTPTGVSMANTSFSAQLLAIARCRGNAQTAHPVSSGNTVFASVATAPQTLALDMSVDQTISVTVVHANAADSVTLQDLAVEVKNFS